MRRITVFAGGYGSGKTEVAINYALGLLPGDVQLVDLDVVTPYFRLRDVRKKLAARSLQVLAGPASELPVLPAGLAAVLGGTGRVVVDVGGDAVGARVLASVADSLPAGSYTSYLVVNPYRPFALTVEGILASFAQIQEALRVRVDGLVVNSHLGAVTTAGTVLRGYRLVLEAARRLALPIVAVAVSAALAPQVPADQVGGKVWVLELFLTMPWEM
ncbi:MAG TPA: hypothetical protein DCM14_05905 [Clostridiales bacterium UBA8153]|nr:hypothetical protein [Clostridiales bacterium UBA8153]